MQFVFQSVYRKSEKEVKRATSQNILELGFWAWVYPAPPAPALCANSSFGKSPYISYCLIRGKDIFRNS